MDDITKNSRALDDCLDSPFFESAVYDVLRKTVTEKEDKLPDLAI